MYFIQPQRLSILNPWLILSQSDRGLVLHIYQSSKELWRKYARYPVEKESDIRRIRMKHFPYTVYFRELTGSVQVLAVAHHRQRPGYWLGRL